jgi:hypothetical protein
MRWYDVATKGGKSWMKLNAQNVVGWDAQKNYGVAKRMKASQLVNVSSIPALIARLRIVVKMLTAS